MLQGLLESTVAHLSYSSYIRLVVRPSTPAFAVLVVRQL